MHSVKSLVKKMGKEDMELARGWDYQMRIDEIKDMLQELEDLTIKNPNPELYDKRTPTDKEYSIIDASTILIHSLAIEGLQMLEKEEKTVASIPDTEEVVK